MIRIQNILNKIASISPVFSSTMSCEKKNEFYFYPAFVRCFFYPRTIRLEVCQRTSHPIPLPYLQKRTAVWCSHDNCRTATTWQTSFMLAFTRAWPYPVVSLPNPWLKFKTKRNKSTPTTRTERRFLPAVTSWRT